VSDAAAAYLRRRRAAVMAHATATGIDWADVAPGASPSQRLLTLHFIPATPANQGKLGVLSGVSAADLRFTVGGEPAGTSLQATAVAAVTAAADPLLQITLSLVGSGPLAAGGTPVAGIELTGVSSLDPFFARASFSLDPSPRDADCLAVCPPPPAPVPDAPIDYQARDWASFRRLMLDRLTLLLPGWSEENPADLWVTLVELLADAADQVSYFQDAVATEAYLGTARLRVSVRRHARLAGYRMHEGAGARVWVQLQTASATGVTVPLSPPTAVLSRVAGAPLLLAPGSPELEQALAASPVVFETLHGATLYAAHGSIPLYDWGAPEYGLAAGATAATLRGRFPNLQPGDVLALAEAKGPATGLAADADPRHRQAVRLTTVTLGQDLLAAGGPQDVTEVQWHADDALKGALCISTVLSTGPMTAGGVALGNLVLAGQGRTVPAEDLGPVPPAGRPFQPTLALPDLTFQRPYDHTAALAGSAAAVLTAGSADALPAVTLAGPQGTWRPVYDLLSSAPTDAVFVVEMDDDRRAHLRFGDGVLGLAPVPGQALAATYRVGNSSAGNIGPDSLVHVVSSAPLLGASNPLPGQGGTDPELLDVVRLAAPQVFHETDANGTTADLARLAETFPDVARAAATLRWTGSWHTLFLGVERASGSPIDATFQAALARFVESDRIAGWELEIGALRYVGLDIAITVTLEPGASRGQVEAGLESAFGNRDLPDGRRGFFHPASFTFGQPVYLSRVIAAALAVPGVAAVDLDDTPPKPNRFRRYGEPPRGELARGEISIGGLEIARLDSDPAAPQRGRIRFFLEGGR
jgi:hypothetical protein